MKTITSFLYRISPSWIRLLDRFFLLHYPMIWIIKIHFILYYSLITTALFATIGLFIPLSIDNSGFTVGLPVNLLVVEIAIIVLWVVNIPSVGLGLYNYSIRESYFEVLCYAAGISLIILPSFAMYHTLRHNASKVVHIDQISRESGAFSDAGREILKELSPGNIYPSISPISLCSEIGNIWRFKNDNTARDAMRKYFPQPRSIYFNDTMYSIDVVDQKSFSDYCRKLVNAQSTSEFVESRLSIMENGFYVIHEFIIASCWIALSFRYFRREVALYIASLVIAFIIAFYLVTYIISIFKVNGNALSLVVSCCVTLFLIQRVISIKPGRRYSVLKAFCITTLPLSIAFSALVAVSSVINDASFQYVVFYVFSLAFFLAHLLLIPYLRRKHAELFESPRE